MIIKPILFSTEMVQAILNGTKKQTRRIKGLDKYNVNPNWWRYYGQSIYDDQASCYYHYMEVLDIQGEPKEMYDKVKSTVKRGDVFWVRETFEKVKVQNAPVNSTDWLSINKYKYKADTSESFVKWKPSIFMPKEACRIWLKVTNVRCERLHGISEYDARKEGVEHLMPYFKDYLNRKEYLQNAYASFRSLWESINGLESWKSNPWVWVYEFERCEMPKNF